MIENLYFYVLKGQTWERENLKTEQGYNLESKSEENRVQEI